MKYTNWYKANPSILWLIERAPTEEILVELMEHAVKLQGSNKTRRRWADACEVRFNWLKANPPTFEPVSVAEMLASSIKESPFEIEGFEAQRAGKTMEDCPYDIVKFEGEPEIEEEAEKESQWRNGFIRALDTPPALTDYTPKPYSSTEEAVKDVNQSREWFCAENGLFSFEGEGKRQVTIHEYFSKNQ
jgi:flavodoxin